MLLTIIYLLFVLHVLKPLHLTAASLLFLHPGLFALALDGLALLVPQPLGLGSVVLLLLGLGQGKPFFLFQPGLLFPPSGFFLCAQTGMGSIFNTLDSFKQLIFLASLKLLIFSIFFQPQNC